MLPRLLVNITSLDYFLNRLLILDLRYVTKKIHGEEPGIILSRRFIVACLKALDFATTDRTNDSKNKIIAIIALLWEHIDHDEYDLRSIILKFMTRIGYPTSAIIADSDYGKNNNRFSPLISKIDELTLSMNYLKYSYELGHKGYLLTEFQIKLVNLIDKKRILGISAPTSAGKTFAIILKTTELLVDKGYDIIYIVPTLSLQNQIVENYTKLLINQKKQSIITCVYQPNEEDIETVYVLTQERALSALSNSLNSFTRPFVLVVDEIQNIERVSDEENTRSKVLLDMLNEFRHMSNAKKIIISGPRIEEIGALGESIFGAETTECVSDISPVINITYSLSKENNVYFLKQYYGSSKPKKVEVRDQTLKGICGLKRYDDKYLDYLFNFIDKVGSNQQNIIFAPTPQSARRIASHFEMKTEAVDILPKLKSLSEYYAETVHPDYALRSTVLKGAAYHHGRLPMHVRRTLEKAITSKLILNVACTTTLMQGVNLPAQNVFIRNPHLFLRRTKNSTSLSHYEITNLRGRAGRLMNDFLGRTYILDEDQFLSEESEQLNLFEDTTKKINADYKSRFDNCRQQIEDAIETDDLVSGAMEDYGFLVTFIRQSVLRHGRNAAKRLKEVGIELSITQVADIQKKLDSLTLPIEACLNNRYWDPFVLEDIYTEFNEQLPRTPYDRNSTAQLKRILLFLRDNQATSEIFLKAVPPTYRSDNNLGMLCDYGIKWGKGKKLKDILDCSYCRGEEAQEHIEDVIKLLQDTISYDIALLIKPLFDLFGDDGAFVKALQNGACDVNIIKLTELGIPRETAIFLDEVLQDKEPLEFCSNESTSLTLRQAIRRIKKELPYWVRVQVEYI